MSALGSYLVESAVEVEGGFAEGRLGDVDGSLV